MKKLKDLCLSVLLNEGEDVFSLSPEEVGDVVDVSVIDDDIKIDFETTYGKPTSLVTKVSDFKDWSLNNPRVQSFNMMSNNTFKSFVIDFLSNSSVGDETLNEIVDDDGNIDLDGDMPNNSTNTMVTSPKFDLEKIYKSFVPKSIRFYSGDLGLGIITW
jgi:hypothetical protein